MTDTSSLAATHPLPQPHPVTAPSLASPLVNGSLSDTNGQDEEDYTIKCICTYADDDGNTVYCEQCDTWQHIECYYHGKGIKDIPEEHFCADCRPRELDSKRATERQKRIREQVQGGGGGKVKRPSSKKRRTKENGPNNEQTNGWHTHDRHDSVLSNKDQPPPPKKVKTSHRNSASVASLNGTPHFSESRKRASSNVQSYPSPSKSPQDLFHFPSIPKYTLEFLELYDRDEGGDNVLSEAKNVYNMQVLNKINGWRADPHQLEIENARQNQEPPFHDDVNFDPSTWPSVKLEITENRDNGWEGKIPTWRLLRVQADVAKDRLVGEVTGEVGLLEVYSQPDQPNRWQELHHPDPFVFFHPHMNIYIDSKKGGTKFRYLRRSCRPNLTLKTFVSPDGEYHHCFTASKDISAGTELTASWYIPKERFLDENDEQEELQYKRILFFSHLLANFGDCACDRTQQCLLAGVDRRGSSKSLDSSGKQVNGRKRKPKGKHAISPMSTGQATNSRAGSEAVKLLDDDDQYDRQSMSGSSRSNPRSRDMTPTNNVGILDADPVLGPGLSARERRKIAAAEKAFQKVEQDQHVQKKKKRTSGGSNLNTPNASSNYQLGQGGNTFPATPTNMNYVSRSDGRLQQARSDSPPSMRPSDSRHHSSQSLSAGHLSRGAGKPVGYVRPVYFDVSVQTDPEELDDAPPAKRRKFIHPTQRLLRRVLQDRQRHEQLSQGIASASSFNSSSAIEVPFPSPVAQTKSENETEMRDVTLSAKSSSAGSPVMARSPLPSPSATYSHIGTNSTPWPLPSQAAHHHRPVLPPEGRRLQLSTLPPVPTFPNDSANTASTPASGISGLTTPLTAQSPFSFGVGSGSYLGLSGSLMAPSPIKKKLSLGDYLSRRSTIASTPTTEKTQAEATAASEKISPTEERAGSGNSTVMVKPDDSIKEEARAMGANEGSAIEDVPMKDDTPVSTVSEPVLAALPNPPSTQPAGSANTPTTQSNHLDPALMNVLAILRQMTPQLPGQNTA